MQDSMGSFESGLLYETLRNIKNGSQLAKYNPDAMYVGQNPVVFVCL